MPTFFSLINPDDLTQYTIEIDSAKREIYEDEIYDLLNFQSDSKNSMFIICHQSGDRFYLSKELAKKYLIKINTEY